MHGDAVHAGSDLNRVRALSQSATRLQALRDQTVRELDARGKEIDSLTAKIEVLSKVNELFRALMDRLVLDHVKSIESIVTEGLHAIFYDQELGFETEVSQRYSRISIDFFIKQARDRIEVRGHPLHSFGGGPASIASLILRILALMRLKRWPLLLLDETLAAVSDEYIDQTGQFLKRLAETTSIPILLVTHKQAFTEHANVAYLGSESGDSDSHLVLQRLRSTS